MFIRKLRIFAKYADYVRIEEDFYLAFKWRFSLFVICIFERNGLCKIAFGVRVARVYAISVNRLGIFYEDVVSITKTGFAAVRLRVLFIRGVVRIREMFGSRVRTTLSRWPTPNMRPEKLRFRPSWVRVPKSSTNLLN